MYIQDTTRKLYSNRFIISLQDLIELHKDSNESKTHFIENAIIDKLQKLGCDFEMPIAEEERLRREYDVSDIS